MRFVIRYIISLGDVSDITIITEEKDIIQKDEKKFYLLLKVIL